eukprot:UN06036
MTTCRGNINWDCNSNLCYWDNITSKCSDSSDCTNTKDQTTCEKNDCAWTHYCVKEPHPHCGWTCDTKSAGGTCGPKCAVDGEPCENKDCCDNLTCVIPKDDRYASYCHR